MVAADPSEKPFHPVRIDEVAAAVNELQQDMYGNKKRGYPGVLARVKALEEFKDRIENVEFLVKGLGLGLGLNLLGIIIILGQLFHWWG